MARWIPFVPFEERYPPGWLFDPESEKPAMMPIKVPYAETWGAMEGRQGKFLHLLSSR